MKVEIKHEKEVVKHLGEVEQLLRRLEEVEQLLKRLVELTEEQVKSK